MLSGYDKNLLALGFQIPEFSWAYLVGLCSIINARKFKSIRFRSGGKYFDPTIEGLEARAARFVRFWGLFTTGYSTTLDELYLAKQISYAI